mmetsp:Transcript_29542/g.61325  ORF Transcript_29542/g.61325 Transcript_29542/m.61325 type:complete len:97 (+) Transcript_29542:549-839(+)
MIPTEIFQPSSTAGQTNHIPPTERGTAHPAMRGIILDLAQVKAEAVWRLPKSGTGRVPMVASMRAWADMVLEILFVMKDASKTGSCLFGVFKIKQC